ncbi:hypothetical protein VNO80_10465 [Phaseolus coccineus]|uniref:Uncharacterized protein n=1 Tax=Phaseolus coccineus TaxID=3886 RepID=A0AAN9NDH8_PHACN
MGEAIPAMPMAIVMVVVATTPRRNKVVAIPKRKVSSQDVGEVPRPSLAKRARKDKFLLRSRVLLASTASLRPKYPISNMHSSANTCSCRSREFNNTTFEISSFDSISSTIGDLMDLISKHNTSTECTEPIDTKACTVSSDEKSLSLRTESYNSRLNPWEIWSRN